MEFEMKQFNPQKKWVENVELVAVANHMQERLEYGGMYSLSEASMHFPSLTEALRPARPAKRSDSFAMPALTDQKLTLEAEPCLSFSMPDCQAQAGKNDSAVTAVEAGVLPEDSEVAAALQQIAFFRVVRSGATRLKLPQLPPAEVQRLGTQDLIVTFQSAKTIPHLCVSVEPSCSVGVLTQAAVLSICGASTSSENATIPILTASLRSWQVRPQTRFGLRDFMVSEKASEALQQLILHHAFPLCSLDACLCLDSSNVSLLHGLQELSVHQAAEERGSSPASLHGNVGALWSLTQNGMAQLARFHEVRPAERVFRSAETLLALRAEELMN